MVNDPTKCESDIRVALDAGAATKPVHVIDGVPELSSIVVKDGYRVVSIAELDKLRPAPRRKSGTVTLHTPASFIDYVRTFGDTNTILTADLNEQRLDAILDYHEAGKDGAPRWGQHRAVYECRVTEEWQTWADVDGKDHAMGQTEFARFVEDNVPDVAKPDGATLLELVKQLEVRNNVKWTGRVNLTDGARQLFYEEQIEGNAKGDMSIPETFTLGLAPFEGVDKYELVARLRYRVNNGGVLLMWVDLHRPHKVVEDAFNTIVADVRLALSEMRLVHGKVG